MTLLAFAFVPSWYTVAKLSIGISSFGELATVQQLTILKELGLGIVCFVLAFILASLVEYWLHRLMHISPKIGERHRDHHRRNEGQGVLWEFRD